MFRSGKATLALIALSFVLAACGPAPATVQIDKPFHEWAPEHSTLIAKLPKEDAALMAKFVPEYIEGYKNANSRIQGLNYPFGLSGKTLGDAVIAARDFYAQKDRVLAELAQKGRLKAATLASTQAEPQQFDPIGAENAADALLTFKPAGCNAPSDAFVAWVCAKPNLVKLVAEVNKQRDTVSKKIDGKLDSDMFSHDTMALSATLSSCLVGGSQRSACVTQAYIAHGKQMAAYAGQPGDGAAAASPAAAGAASNKTFGAWQPEDYKSMTVADYRAMQLKKLAEAKAYWDKRLPQLVVNSTCSAGTSSKRWSDEDGKLIVQGLKTCDVSFFRTAFSDGDKIKRRRMDIHHVAVGGGCVDAVKWLIEQCIPNSSGYDGVPQKRWEATLIGVGADNEKEWVENNPKFKGILDALAVYRANATDGWDSWGSAVGSGQPDALRLALATGIPIESIARVRLANAIAKFRWGCNQSETIQTEHCAGRLEVIKLLVALGAPLDERDPAWGAPLEQARKDGAKPVVDFLMWAGAKEPAPKEPEKPMDPAVARCLEQVNRTLNTTTGSSHVGLQMEVQRQAQAMRECHALDDGNRPANEGALASVALQAEYTRFADQIAGGRHPNCRFISDDIKSLLVRGGVNSPRVIELVETAKKHGCVL